MLFMFKMFQVSQAKATAALTSIMNEKISFMFVFVLMQVLLLGAAFAWWCYKIK